MDVKILVVFLRETFLILQIEVIHLLLYQRNACTAKVYGCWPVILQHTKHTLYHHRIVINEWHYRVYIYDERNLCFMQFFHKKQSLTQTSAIDSSHLLHLNRWNRNLYHSLRLLIDILKHINISQKQTSSCSYYHAEIKIIDPLQALAHQAVFLLQIIIRISHIAHEDHALALTFL